MAITGIQETKWFGSDVWNADGYTLLHSGRPLPDEGEPQVRNKGVAMQTPSRYYSLLRWEWSNSYIHVVQLIISN